VLLREEAGEALIVWLGDGRRDLNGSDMGYGISKLCV